MNINEQKIIDAMSFMNQVDVLEHEGILDFTDECWAVEDYYNLFEKCYAAWEQYPAEESIHYFAEFAEEWLKNKQVEFDAIKEDKESVLRDYTWELCPHCGEEELIPNYRVSYCPSCGEEIKPCSMCDNSKADCDNCPFDRK